MTELRKRMIEDMELAGSIIPSRPMLPPYASWPPTTAAPDRLSEEQVRTYLLYLRDEVCVARGTFLTHFYGLKFFFVCTLGRDWTLLTKEKYAASGGSSVLANRVEQEPGDRIIPIDGLGLSVNRHRDGIDNGTRSSWGGGDRIHIWASSRMPLRLVSVVARAD